MVVHARRHFHGMSENLNKQFLNAFITHTKSFSLIFCTDFEKRMLVVTFVSTHKSVFFMIDVECLHRLDLKILRAQMIKNYLAFCRINFYYLVFIVKNSINSANFIPRLFD